MAITNSQITGALHQIVTTDGNGNITDITLSNSVVAANGVFSNLNVVNTLVAPTANVSALNVGSAANLGSNGNITITGGTINQVLLNNGSNGLNWVNANTAFIANTIVDGSSNVLVYPSGNVTIGINTNPNVVVVHGNGMIVESNVNVGTNLTVSGHSYLGSNSNVHINGGTFGYFLTTDGNGGLYWTDPCMCGGGGSGGSGVTQIIAGNGITISPTSGTGVVTINSSSNIQPIIEFVAASTGSGLSFTAANLATFTNNTYAAVYINGSLQRTAAYTISGTTLTFTNWINTGDKISVGPTAAGGGSGTVSNVATTQVDPSGLGFTLSGGPITTTGTVTLNVPSSTALKTALGISGYPALNGNVNTYLNGNGQWASIPGTAETYANLGTGTNITIDVGSASYFSKTITAPTNLSVSNIAVPPNVSTFILQVTGGATGITWWPNIRWTGGIVPTLTANTDILGFFTFDNGSNWRGLVLSKDSR
jgi:hypothetical protein